MATNNSGKTAAIAGGVVAAAAALAGAYFLYGTKEGPARRKKIKAWMLKMKADVLEEMENLKDLNEEVYHRAVEAVARNYEKVKDVTPEEVAEIVRELKGYWKPLKRELEAKTHAKRATSKKPAKKPAAKKKAAKK